MATKITPAQQAVLDLFAQVTGLSPEQFLAASKPAMQQIVAVPPVKAPAPRTFATKADLAAGKGFPCTASSACSRTDIRTVGRASRHATTQAELATFGHSADKASLPKV